MRSLQSKKIQWLDDGGRGFLPLLIVVPIDHGTIVNEEQDEEDFDDDDDDNNKIIK